MIKLVVFDWNGTLLADNEAIVAGANAKLKLYGHPFIDVPRLQEVSEIPAALIYKKLGVDPKVIEDTALEAAEAFHTTYERLAASAKTRSGAGEVLQFLTKRGISKIILSNHTAAGIDSQLERLGIVSDFDIVLANENILGAHYKGKKDRLIAYLDRSHIQPKEVMIVGDSPEEVHIGKELGLKTVAITGGASTTKRLKSAKPDVLIHSLRDIIKVLEEW